MENIGEIITDFGKLINLDITVANNRMSFNLTQLVSLNANDTVLVKLPVPNIIN